jgi:hypothetical protein
MKLQRLSASQAPRARRGVALLMAFLVLMVVLAICAQLRMSTASNQRTANNDLGLTRMDYAIESAMQEAMDQLARTPMPVRTPAAVIRPRAQAALQVRRALGPLPAQPPVGSKNRSTPMRTAGANPSARKSTASSCA